jgi:arsenate reductase
MTTLYGLQNCDSCRKARSWLDAHGVEYSFHDFRRMGLPPDRLDHWLDEAGMEILLNRKGSTWRNLPEKLRKDDSDRNLRRLMLEHSSLVKRPVLEIGAAVVVGFSSAQYEVAFEGAD